MNINSKKLTPQEHFWKSDLGNQYIIRNKEKKLITSNLVVFTKIFKHLNNVKSIIEFGCNIGLNLEAIKLLCPDVDLYGVEINQKATLELKRKGVNYFHESFLSDTNFGLHDLTFTKGVLIHQNPKKLPLAYEKLYSHSKRYILIIEYYNPSPISVKYHGEKDKLFKRDFAGELLDIYSDLTLLDYGFTYHRDKFPLDDSTWFLLEKIK